MTRLSLSLSLLGAALLAEAHAQGLSNLEVIERGPHHRVITFTRPVTDAAGQVSIHRGRYTELQMGLHYLENGEWVESQEVVEPAPFGAVAPRLAYRASFTANLNTAGAVDLVLPDGKRLRSHVLGVRMTDLGTGRSQFIALVKDCVGEIVPPNQVLYRNAFEGLAADVRCVAGKGAFEADVVLRESPVLPPGFDPASTRLEVVTEFIDPPVPIVTSVPFDLESGLSDDDLDFGTMRMILGKAFVIGADGASAGQTEAQVPILKRWTKADGRTLFVESMDYLSLRPLLAGLPMQKRDVSASSELKSLPSVGRAKASPEPLEIASLDRAGSGVVLDYTLVQSNPYGYTFVSGETYKVEGYVTVGGPVLFQSGAIIKFMDTACLNHTAGYINTPGIEQPRAILTSVDDYTVGEYIGDGDPTTRSFTALSLYPYPSPSTLKRLEFRYAGRGVSAYSPSASHTVSDCRFQDCNIGLFAYYTTMTLDDLFMCRVSEWTHNNGYSTFTFPPGHENHIIDTCEAFGDPIIQDEPDDQTVGCGQNATFTVVALGEGLTYQWYSNNVSVANATGANYTVYSATLAKAGEYHVIVRSGTASVTSRRAKLTVNCPPQIITQPAPQNVRAGGTASFTVEAIGPGPLTYQWRKGGSPIYDSANRTGTATYKLTLSNVQSSDQGNYSVAVANSYGSVTSVEAPLTVITSDVIYTSNADFDKGYLVNLNHTVVADQLQINANPTPFPYVNMACSGRGTLVRINANNGAIVGEYQTAPDIDGVVIESSPSRTTVDRWGNVWVANREDNYWFGSDCKGSVARIGLVIGGVRGTLNGGTFTPDPNGDYLSPPFLYNTCKDRNSDGYLKTSRGLTDVRRWLNGSGQDTAGGVSTAEDEAILNYVRTACNETRTLAVDKNNNVWVGGLDRYAANPQQRHQQLSALTGLPVANTLFSPGAGGYGGLVDGYGVLWSAAGDLVHMWPPAGTGLVRFLPGASPPPAGTWVVKPPFDLSGNVINGDYGLAIDPKTQAIWHSLAYDYEDHSWVVKLDRATGNMLAKYSHGNDVAQGVAVDNQDNVWVAHSKDLRDVGHLKTSGTFVGNVDLGGAVEAPAGPTGVAVDSNGKIWTSAYNVNSAVRINPNGGAIGGGGFRIGAVDLRVDLGDGSQHLYPHDEPAEPYNYSDMTGFVTLGSTFPSGSWIVAHDEGVLNRQWRKLAWSSNTPANSGIQVEVRAANTLTQLPDQNLLTISSDVQFGPLSGRYLEIRVTLWRVPLSGVNPLLYWLKVYAPQ